MSCDLAVTSGQVLPLRVGAVGGADAGDGGTSDTLPGGDGGGASDLRTQPGDLSARVLVAGGGGGGGAAGGGDGGDAGGAGQSTLAGGGGAAGASTGGAGGNGYLSGDPGTAGAFGVAGDGGDSLGIGGGGGGGGGGWYGGGGGGGSSLNGAGGGGGSSYAGTGVTNCTQAVAISPGDGSVALKWDDPPPDTTPPTISITKKPKSKIKTKKKSAKVKVSFSSEAGATFTCKLDKADYKPCTSPYSAKAKSKGGKGKKHTFSIQATDQAGNVGKPATVKFKVIRKG